MGAFTAAMAVVSGGAVTAGVPVRQFWPPLRRRPWL